MLRKMQVKNTRCVRFACTPRSPNSQARTESSKRRVVASRCLVLLALLSTFTMVSSSSSARPIWMPAWSYQ